MECQVGKRPRMEILERDSATDAVTLNCGGVHKAGAEILK